MTLESRFRDMNLNVPSKKSEGNTGRLIWEIPLVTRKKLKRIFELDETPEFICFYGGKSIDKGLRIENLGNAFYTLYRTTSAGVFQIIKNKQAGSKSFYSSREKFDTPGRVYTKKSR